MLVGSMEHMIDVMALGWANPEADLGREEHKKIYLNVEGGISQ